MRHTTSALALWLGAAILVALTACAGNSDDAASEGASTKTTIGAAGGVAVSADGSLRLTVPAGALTADTSISISEVAAADVPDGLRVLDLQRAYRLEPAGTRFAVPVTVSVALPPSADGNLAAMLLETSGAFEVPAGLAFRGNRSGRTVTGTISHFSNILVQEYSQFTAVLSVSATEVDVGQEFTGQGSLRKSTAPHSAEFMGISLDASPPANRTLLATDPASNSGSFQKDIASLFRLNFAATCESAGKSKVTFSGRLSTLTFFVLNLASPTVPLTADYDIAVDLEVECQAGPLPPADLVAVGLFNIPGLTAPDGISYFAGPLANLTGTGRYASVAGAEGVKVVDLVTRQVVLDRTATGPDGATLGTSPLGVTPVAQAASAGAAAAMIGYSSGGAFVQNWNATASWGGTARDFEPTFDVVTAGSGLVSNTVALVRPVFGIDFLEFDLAALVYRAAQTRFAPLSAFPGGGQLVSAQMPDAATGGVLALSRATSAGGSTSSKVFFKNVDDTQPATTLLSWGNVDTRRLRCLPVGTKQACVASLFGGEGRAFLFDPASPRDTPRVIVLTAAPGTLGVALTALPNGHVGVVMANFTASSLTVAEVSADLLTIHSLNTTPAPAGCTGTAHPALLSDSEGIKAVVTCNGTSNYWVVKPFS